MAEAPPTAAVLDNNRACVVCGYNLRGLPFDGRCPECGSAVQRSLQGNLLRFSAAEYLATLHRGVFLIEASIIAQVIGWALAFGAGLLAAALTGTPMVEIVRWATAMLLTVAGFVGLVGWWLLSVPDPAYSGVENGATARRIVRVTVVINAIGSLASFLPNASVAVTRWSALASPTAALLWAISVAALIAWVGWFFAAMRYLQWLAPRLPDPRVKARAKALMWVGPILYTVGAIACGLGPLVALILYYNLLNWVREGLQRIRSDQSLREAAGIPL